MFTAALFTISTIAQNMERTKYPLTDNVNKMCKKLCKKTLQLGKNLDELGRYYVKWNKPKAERRQIYMISPANGILITSNSVESKD